MVINLISQRYGVYTRVTDYLDWMDERISEFLTTEVEEQTEEPESVTEPEPSPEPNSSEECNEVWCDFTSTIVIIVIVLLCLLIVIFLFLIVRKIKRNSLEEKKKMMFMRTETELDAFGEENEFTFLAGVKPTRESMSPRKSTKPKVHRIIDLEEERSSNDGSYIENMQTFNSIRSKQSLGTQGTMGSEAGYSSNTIKSFLQRTKTQSSITSSNPASTASKRKTLKLTLTDSERVDVVVTDGVSFESIDERIESNEADMDIGGMFEGMLGKDVSDARDVLGDLPKMAEPQPLLSTRISMSEDASHDFEGTPKLARNTSLTASMRVGDYFKTSVDDHMY